MIREDAAGIEGRLARIESLLAAVLERLAAAEPPVLDDDLAVLRDLLPRVRARYGEAVWTVADLAADRIVEPGEARRLGRLLARNAGATVDDLVLHAVGADREGRMWVLRVLNR